MQSQPSVKRPAFLTLGGIIFIILIIWLWNYLHTGKVIITTNNPNDTISLTLFSATNANNSSNNGSKPYANRGKLSVVARAGQYLAVVEGNSIATRQIVKVSAHKTLKYEIDPVNSTGVEPVAYITAQDTVEGGSQLIFLNTSSHTLYKIDDQNNLSTLATKQLQNIKWADSSFGVGQDSNGHLYLVEAGQVSPLNVPFTYDNRAVDFDISADKEIYVSHGSAVYLGSQAGSFKKIYTATSSEPELAAGKNDVAVADAPSDVGDNVKPLLAIVAQSGRIIKETIEAHRLAWSPNGQYLLDEESLGNIYSSSLKKVATLPASFIIGSASWLDDSNLVYSNNDQLWIYNLTDQKAQILANMPLANYITGLSIAADKSYIYLTTIDASGDGAIRRVGLKNQMIPKFIYELQSILPLSVNQCTLSLRNFTQPGIVVQSSANQAQGCIPIAQSTLQQRGFNISLLSFKTSG